MGDFGDKDMASEICDLWLEYEDGTTIEAEAAKQLDKFEMIVQANEYELVHPEKKLDSFFKSTENSFSHPEVSNYCVMFQLHYTCNISNFSTLTQFTYLDRWVGGCSACRAFSKD